MVLLFRGLIGSRMYGLHTTTSDYDYYEVFSETGYGHRTNQIISGTQDVTQVSLNHFVYLAMKGSHQALDAMFTPYTEVDMISGLRSGFRAGFNAIVDFERIITELAAQDIPKKRLHAARIAYNLNELAETGRYNPVLKPSVKEHILRVSRLPAEEFTKELNRISPLVNIE